MNVYILIGLLIKLAIAIFLIAFSIYTVITFIPIIIGGYQCWRDDEWYKDGSWS